MNGIAKNGFATRRESKKQITPAVSSERSTVSTSTKTGRVESCVLPRADRHHDLIEGTPQWGENVRTQRYSTLPHPTNQAVAKLGTVPGA